MRKIYMLLAGMVCAVALHAQTTLPRPVYSLTFEGATTVADVNGTQVGDGELRQSTDPNFGTYYQNAPNAAVTTKATNYLRIETDGLKKAGDAATDAISIGFWVNPTVANLNFPNINYYYSVLYTFYTAGNRGLKSSDGWNGPMWAQNARGWLQINDWAGRWDDFGGDENVNGSNQENIDWLKQKTVEEVVKDSEGNDSIALVPTDFNDNWHYVALVLSQKENTASVYVDAQLFNQWNCKSDFYTDGTASYFFKNLGNYADLYLGGVAQWTWADPDPAFAYDDFTIYAAALNEEQQQLVMKIKSGEVDDDVRLALAQNEFIAVMDEYEDFLGELEDYQALFEGLETYATDIADKVDEDPSVEGYKQGAADILARMEEIKLIVAACNAAKANITAEMEYADRTNYPGKDAYLATLEAVLATLDNPTSAADAETANASVSTAKGIYVTSQEIPADGTGIDVTALVLHPWFANPDAEPTQNEDGSYSFPYESDHGYANNTTPADANSAGWVNGNSFVVDDARVNWTEGRITWNNWHNKTTVGSLDVHQNLTGLPAGYYSVSADWITNAAPTTQHTYATANGVTKVSAVLDNQGWDAQQWTTLATDKILVGEDGLLTIGAASTTIGQAYVGWFCVTNFRLIYYGMDVDLTADLKAKQEAIAELVSTLTFKGDAAAANAEAESIVANNDTYNAIALLTSLIDKTQTVAAEENAFTASFESFNDEIAGKSATAAAALKSVSNSIAATLEADSTTVAAIPGFQALMDAYRAYAVVAEAAEAWSTASATAKLEEQAAIFAASTPDAEAVKALQDELTAIMKSSISDKTADENNPVDITAFLVNPSFTGDSHAGWTIATGTPANYYSECEFYNSNFNIYQIVSGLPAGFYRFAVQGFYRDGSCETAYTNSTTIDEETGEASNVLNAKLYANEMQSDIQSWANFFVKGEQFNGYWSPNATDETVEAEDVLFFANTMEAANILFDQKQLNVDGNSVDFYLDGTQDAKLGIRKDTTISADWTIFDNFHLYYIGKDAPTAIEQVTESIASRSTLHSSLYTLSGQRVSSITRSGLYIVNGKKVMVK